jgi:hypothetical protein
MKKILSAFVLFAFLSQSVFAGIPPFANAPATVGNITNLIAMLRSQGYSIASSLSSISMGTGETFTYASGGGSSTAYTEYVAPWDMLNIRVVDWNTQRATVNGNVTGSALGNNPIRYQYALIEETTNATFSSAWPVYPITFNNNEGSVVLPGKIVISDPVNAPLITKGSKYLIAKTQSCVFGPQPTAPVVTVGNGSYDVGAGTYQFAYTVLYSNGTESNISLPTAATLANSGTNGTASITLPAATPGAIGCRIFVSQVGASSTAVVYDSGLGVIPMGATQIWPTYFITWGSTSQFAGNQRSLNQLYMLSGIGTAGGVVAPYGRGTADDRRSSSPFGSPVDYTVPGIGEVGNQTNNHLEMAVAVLAQSPKGYQPSIVLNDESIGWSYQLDGGFGQDRGNWFNRFCLNQFSQYQYTDTVTPNVGYMNLACGSESMATYGTWQYGYIRWLLEPLASTAVLGYGVNDSWQSSTVLTSIQIASRHVQQGMAAIQTTMIPRTLSTDGFTSITNQTYVNNTAEGLRRSLNNFYLNTGGPLTITGENLWRAQVSSYGPSSTTTNGDGSTTLFDLMNYALEGSEQVYVNGVLKTVSTDYNYTNPVTVNGSIYFAQITFVTAPANGLSTTINYTSIPGWKKSVTTLAGVTNPHLAVWDKASVVEVDKNRAAGTNGGWWNYNTTAPLYTGTLTAVLNQVYTDNTKTPTANDASGWNILITADAGTPTAIGQVNSIIGDTTAGAFTCVNNFGIQPDVGASYSIIKTLTIDGTHPSSDGAMLMASVPKMSDVY